MRFYLSTNTLLDSPDVEIGSRSVAAIAAGASDSASTTLTLPVSTPTGTYFILAKADDDEAVAETSETNNVRAGWIRIGP
jgi:subtilase family serine protease